MDLYGRSRKSIADIEQNLHDIFNNHPDSYLNDAGDPVIPADALVDVFKAFSQVYNGVQLMSDQEMEMMKSLLASNPGLEVTPQILLGFVAEKTKTSPPTSPGNAEEAAEEAGNGSGNEGDSGGGNGVLRGRGDDRDQRSPAFARSSSSESAGNPPPYPISSRRSSLGPPPHTPQNKASPFDTERRQRSRPLTAPSSWNNKRPAPASRRKSDAGSRSDSESGDWSRGPSRSASRNGSRNSSRNASRNRGGASNPTSPSPMSPEPTFSPSQSPHIFSGPPSRPHSRALSQPHISFNNFGHYGDADDRDDLNHTITSADSSFELVSGSLAPRFGGRGEGSGSGDENDDSFLNSFPMPRRARPGLDADADSDSDPDDHDSDSAGEEEDETSLGLVMDRSTTSSNASMEPIDRLEVLQRANTELSRKLMEAERTLQIKLGQHEADLEDMQGRLDGMQTELSAMKREEKELRSKERQNMQQISALESEVAKYTKALEHARVTYTSLQRQYQEQCSFSDKYRDDLRNREEIIRDLRETISLHDVETIKWARERDSWEERIIQLENELLIAQQAHAQLDEQKQENMLLKETIDRMKFEMDEMRNSLQHGLSGPGMSGPASANNTLSKSLGAELLGKMKWGLEDEDSEPEHKGGMEEEVESVSTAVDDEDEDEEDVIQTIITRKTRKKVASRANKLEPTPTLTTFEELKEYSDSSTQYEPEWFTSSIQTQTDPEPKTVTASLSIQTDPEVKPARVELEAQTEPLPALVEKKTVDMDIQTDALQGDEASVLKVEVEAEAKAHVEMEIQTEPVVIVEEHQSSATTRSSSPFNEHDESLASSSSTIIPPTPRASSKPLQDQGQDQQLPPPSYHQITTQEEEWSSKMELLRKYHPGAGLDSIPAPLNGVKPSTSATSTSTTTIDGLLSTPDVNIDPLHDHSNQAFLSEETVEEWKALKEELGVGCLVIDKIVENAERNGRMKRGSSSGSSGSSRRRSGKFFNIYNTYVYGKNGVPSEAGDAAGGAGADPGSGGGISLSTALLAVGISTFLGYALSSLQSSPTQIVIPGGPTYYDRSAWHAFNTLGGVVGEGFGMNGAAARHGVLGIAGVGGGWLGGAVGGGGGGWGWGGVDAAAAAGAGNVGIDGTASVWNFLGRVGGGAARIVRGWPT